MLISLHLRGLADALDLRPSKIVGIGVNYRAHALEMGKGLPSEPLMFLKPLVPRRGAGKPLAAYWADPAVAPTALRVWFILEGAGVVASVSYFLGGGLIAAALIVLTVAVYWMNGPGVFAGE